MSLNIFRKSMSIAYASMPGFERSQVEEAGLVLASMAPDGDTYSSEEQSLEYIFTFGAWVREIEGEITIINAISMPIGYLSHWDDTWPEALHPGKDLLDDVLIDSLDLLDECGGSMAKENLPGAQALVDHYLATEGPLDKFGRKTIIACAIPEDPDPFEYTSNFEYTNDCFSWYRTMPDEKAATIKKLNESVRESIWDLNPCQPPTEVTAPVPCQAIEELLFDCDADVGSGHSGFILMNVRTYADIRKHGVGYLDIESRKEHLEAGIMGRFSGAVIIIRSANELNYGDVLVADETLKYTASLYIP